MLHCFTATIYKFSSNPSFHCVDVSAEVSTAFGQKEKVPVSGTVNGCEWHGTLLPNGQGGHRMVLNGEIRKQARIGLGQTIEIVLQLNAAPHDTVLPEELVSALRANDLLDQFHALTPGLQRAVLQRLEAAKTRPTWERRVEELVVRLATNNWRRSK